MSRCPGLLSVDSHQLVGITAMLEDCEVQEGELVTEQLDPPGMAIVMEMDETHETVPEKLTETSKEVTDGCETAQSHMTETDEFSLSGTENVVNYQASEAETVMTPLSADAIDIDLADVTDADGMSHPTTSASSLCVDDWASVADNMKPSDLLKLFKLPDVIASHGAERKYSFSNKLNDFFCTSSSSENFIETCSSSDHENCKKRNAFVFPELMADVGGCLCSRRTPRIQYSTTTTTRQNFTERCSSTGLRGCKKRNALVFPELVADVGGCLCSKRPLQIQHSTMMPGSAMVLPLPDLIVSNGSLTLEKSPKFRMPLGKTILVTGGAGYVGSHSVIELIESGYDIVVVDNLVNASMESVRRVEKIVGKEIPSYSVDLLDKAALEDVFKKHKVSAVIHFAGLKAVGESCEIPLLYYKTNVGGTTNLLEVMEANGVFNLVFSSSATVYGAPQFLPLTENHPVGGCTNPYGKTKFMIEQILNDLSASNKKWNIVILRYFNPVGAHKSGTIGEDPSGVPNNLMPFIGQVAVGRRSALKVYGSDYDTPDGTGVRDYIHVVDLAQGHVAAVRKLGEDCGLKVYNLGTGHGYSVLEMAKAFEKASGKKIPYELADRRPGDIASCYSDPSLATKELNWTAKKGLDEMCTDLWRWQSQNPKGYNVDGKQE